MVLGGTGVERKVHEDIRERCGWHKFLNYWCLTPCQLVRLSQSCGRHRRKKESSNKYHCAGVDLLPANHSVFQEGVREAPYALQGPWVNDA